MPQFWSLTGIGVLADAGDLVEMLAPLILFAIYAVGALIKRFAQNQSEDEKNKQPSDLRQAVQKRYEEIRARQVGQNKPAKEYPVRSAKPVKVVPNARFQDKPAPTPETRPYPTPAVRQPRPQRSGQQEKIYLQKARRPRQVQIPSQTQIQTNKISSKSVKPKVVKIAPERQHLLEMIKDPVSIRNAIILKEILDKPLSLR